MCTDAKMRFLFGLVIANPISSTSGIKKIKKYKMRYTNISMIFQTILKTLLAFEKKKDF